MRCRIAAVADELYDALMRFHREVVQPELDEFRAEVRSRFDEMATKAELQTLRAEMATKAELQTLRAEMATKAELQTLRAEMATKAELQSLRTEMVAEMVAMRSEMVTWPVLM